VKNKNIEAFTLWGVYFFSSLVVLVYAFLFMERCLFDGIEKGGLQFCLKGFLRRGIKRIVFRILRMRRL